MDQLSSHHIEEYLEIKCSGICMPFDFAPFCMPQHILGPRAHEYRDKHAGFHGAYSDMIEKFEKRTFKGKRFDNVEIVGKSLLIQDGAVVQVQAGRGYSSLPTGHTIKEKFTLEDIQNDLREFHQLVQKLEETEVEKAILIETPWEGIYGHWIIDSLPIIWLYRDFILEHNLSIIMTRRTPIYIRRWLASIGIELGKNLIIMDDENERVKVSELYLLPNILRGPFYPGIMPARQWQEYGAWLVGDAGTNVSDAVKDLSGKDIFLSRSGSNIRRLLNRDEVEARVADKGVEIIHPSKLNIAEQLYLYKNCKSLTTECGSGMHNNVFCSPGAAIWVLRSTARCFSWLRCHEGIHSFMCIASEQNYSYLLGQSVQPDFAGSQFSIDLQDLECMLDTL